jgi:hypothetical protein
MTADWWFGLINGFGASLILWWVVDRQRPRWAGLCADNPYPSEVAPRTYASVGAARRPTAQHAGPAGSRSAGRSSRLRQSNTPMQAH